VTIQSPPDSELEPEPPQSQIEPTTFLQFNLSEEELKAASTINPVNKLLLHNLRTQTAREILNSIPQSASYEALLSFHQQRAYLKGKLDLLDELLGE
jgi:hypothetical protein